MKVRFQSDRGTTKKNARVIAEDARVIAASYPADPFVQGTVAETEFDVGNYKAAIAAAERAIAADPNSVQGFVYKGRAMMELARAEPAKADWAAIRRTFVQANRADLENAEPLWLFYETFAAAGEEPTKSAIDGLLYAHFLVPQDRSLRLTAVRQLLLTKRHAHAARAFAPLVFDPHASLKEQPVMLSAWQKMKSGDSSGALAILDKEAAAEDKSAGS
jgi:tetratricopeptide (TPR) repeat protein